MFSSMLTKQHKQEAGRAIHLMNQRALSMGAEHKLIKSCFDQVKFCH